MSATIPDTLTRAAALLLEAAERYRQSPEGGTNANDIKSEFSNLLESVDGGAGGQRVHATATDGPQETAEEPANGSSAAATTPSWLQEAKTRYDVQQKQWEQVEARQEQRWNDPEALRKVQETYHPDGTVRQGALDWLSENMGSGWRSSAPHVMETGNLLGEELPSYLQEHQERYLAMKERGDAMEAAQAARWESNPEALTKLQETYHPDVSTRREAVAWLEENMGSGWRASAPHVMETMELLGSEQDDSALA